MKILVTGFEPFGESSINPSQMLVESLSESDFEDVMFIKAVLPVDQVRAPEKIRRLINQHNPEALLAFGLAMGRPKISLERVALNLQDFRIPDNQGITIKDHPIHSDGPAAYFSTLPLQAMLSALLSAGIPAEISLSAGAYLCNLIFYTSMHTLTANHSKVPAGFIHLPALPEQAVESTRPIPSLSFKYAKKAAMILINKLIEFRKE